MKSPLLLFSLCVVLFVCYSPCVLLSLCVTLLVCWSPCEVHNKTPFLCKSRFRLVVLSSKTSTFKCMISNLHPERHYGNCLEQTCIGRLKTSMVLRQKSWTDLHRTLKKTSMVLGQKSCTGLHRTLKDKYGVAAKILDRLASDA